MQQLYKESLKVEFEYNRLTFGGKTLICFSGQEFPENIIVDVFVEKRESIASKQRPNLIIESGKEIAWYKGNITMKASVIPSCQPMHLSFSHPAPTLDKWRIYLRPSVHPWACCS